MLSYVAFWIGTPLGPMGGKCDDTPRPWPDRAPDCNDAYVRDPDEIAQTNHECPSLHRATGAP